jgi:hypothetical protein
MTIFLYILLAWTGGAAIALILNYAIHSTDKDDD